MIIEAAVELSVLAPGSETVVTVSSQISVAETVLIGNVPESYAYISGQGAGKYYPFNGAQGEGLTGELQPAPQGS